MERGMLTWRERAAIRRSGGPAMDLIDQQATLIARLGEALTARDSEIERYQTGMREAHAISLVALSDAFVTREVLATVMAHLAHGEAPAADAQEQIELFLADAELILVEDAATAGRSDHERYREALRDLRETTLARLGLHPEPAQE